MNCEHAQTATIQQINDLLIKKPVISARMAGTWIQIPLLPELAEIPDSDFPIFFFSTALDRLHQRHHCGSRLPHYHKVIYELERVWKNIEKIRQLVKSDMGTKLNEFYLGSRPRSKNVSYSVGQIIKINAEATDSSTVQIGQLCVASSWC